MWGRECLPSSGCSFLFKTNDIKQNSTLQEFVVNIIIYPHLAPLENTIQGSVHRAMQWMWTPSLVIYVCQGKKTWGLCQPYIYQGPWFRIYSSNGQSSHWNGFSSPAFWGFFCFFLSFFYFCSDLYATQSSWTILFGCLFSVAYKYSVYIQCIQHCSLVLLLLIMY